MAFVGFTAIVVVLRQGVGKRLLPLHVLVTSLFVELGHMATAFAMLASTLAMFGISEHLIWQASSVIMLAALVPWLLTYPKPEKGCHERKITSSLVRHDDSRYWSCYCSFPECCRISIQSRPRSSCRSRSVCPVVSGGRFSRDLFLICVRVTLGLNILCIIPKLRNLDSCCPTLCGVKAS